MENWIDAIGSLMSAIAAIASTIIAIKFGDLQKKQEKNAQKIALFDKRYEIYKTMVEIYEIMKFALTKDNLIAIPNYLVVANMVLERYGLMKDKTFLSEHLRLKGLITASPKEESDQADRDLFYLDWYANNQLLQLRGKILSHVEPSKFCFEKNIYDIFIHAL